MNYINNIYLQSTYTCFRTFGLLYTLKRLKWKLKIELRHFIDSHLIIQFTFAEEIFSSTILYSKKSSSLSLHEIFPTHSRTPCSKNKLFVIIEFISYLKKEKCCDTLKIRATFHSSYSYYILRLYVLLFGKSSAIYGVYKLFFFHLLRPRQRY